MASETKTEGLPDLDDLLQCPVCYEIPTGQIFQCNEGHHVCGRCKARLALCPVCRAFFFGTRNYAMEELIANVRKLQAFKLGGKMTVTSGSGASESTTSADNSVAGAGDGSIEDEDVDESEAGNLRAPAACKGLFRCLCCKNGNSERLPAARLLNHLRYFHSRDLIEGKSDNGEYVQAWQISTVPGRIVIAVRVADMGIFFLIIEISDDVIYSWVSMAAAPFVAHEFSYTITISGNDREAIFTDCVWSVRSCEGALKKRGRCLHVDGADARALTATENISGRITLRRAPEQAAQPAQPRAFVRVANRGTGGASVDGASSVVAAGPPRSPPRHSDLEPFLQHLQNDVARLSRAFATLGREANALVRQEAEVQATVRNANRTVVNQAASDAAARRDVEAQVPEPAEDEANNENGHLSRNARRRLRRLRGALNNSEAMAAAATSSQNGGEQGIHQIGIINVVPQLQQQRHLNNTPSQQQRQINNDAAQQPRQINNNAAQQQRQINNNAAQQPRQINNSATQQQRQINSNAAQQPRQTNNSAAQQPRQINNSATQQPRQTNNSAAQQQRQTNNSAPQQQRQINNSPAQQPRHISNSAARQQQRQINNQQQRRQPVNNVVIQEQPQHPRDQTVQTFICPSVFAVYENIVDPVEAPSGSSGPSQNENRPRSNKKKRSQQRW